jgi:hypothetical protein
MYQEPIIFDAEFALQHVSGKQLLFLKMLSELTDQYVTFAVKLKKRVNRLGLDSAKQQCDKRHQWQSRLSNSEQSV